MIRIRRIVLVSILAMMLIGDMIAMGCSEGLGAVRGPEVGNLYLCYRAFRQEALSDYPAKEVCQHHEVMMNSGM